MDAQTIFLGGHVARVRELRAANAKLTAENAALRAENEQLRAHFDLALLAEGDLRGLKDGETLEIWDGWNLILGATKAAHGREELFAKARARLAADPGLRIWIVLDGPRATSTEEGRLRISYTGGEGLHRADRFICDFVRMAAWRGLRERVKVWTYDKDFKRDAQRL